MATRASISLALVIVSSMAAGCRGEDPCRAPTVPTCALPTYVPIDEVDGWDEFLPTASALVCIRALREGRVGPLYGSWCHPGFIHVYLRRAGITTLPVYPTELADECLSRLETSPDWFAAAFRCLDLLECGPGESCSGPFSNEGEPCGHYRPCLASYCDDGVCTRSLGECHGACAAHEMCVYGWCIGTGVGGDACICDDQCGGSVCVDGRCAGPRPIGCDCADDIDCPGDVAVCLEGVCTLRPMLGEACIEGAPCFGSTCIDGVCARFPRGERGCVVDDECEEGLACLPVSECSFPDCVYACR